MWILNFKIWLRNISNKEQGHDITVSYVLFFPQIYLNENEQKTFSVLLLPPPSRSPESKQHLLQRGFSVVCCGVGDIKAPFPTSWRSHCSQWCFRVNAFVEGFPGTLHSHCWAWGSIPHAAWHGQKNKQKTHLWKKKRSLGLCTGSSPGWGTGVWIPEPRRWCSLTSRIHSHSGGHVLLFPLYGGRDWGSEQWVA